MQPGYEEARKSRECSLTVACLLSLHGNTRRWEWKSHRLYDQTKVWPNCSLDGAGKIKYCT